MTRPIIQNLLNATLDPDRHVRAKAYALLRRRAADVAAELLPQLRCDDSETRGNAFRILRRIGCTDATIPTLIELSFGGGQAIRRWAARTLATLTASHEGRDAPPGDSAP